MGFYIISISGNNKIVGNYNQAINAIHHCDLLDNPKFIDRINFEKINFEPITSNAIIEKKAKLTDLINASCIGFSQRLLISYKLMNIIDKYSNEKCQFFKSPVIYKNEKVEEYWVTHPYIFNFEYVDFNKSIVNVRRRKPEGGTEKILLKINSLEEFNMLLNFHREKEEIVLMSNIYLKDNIDDDFFVLGQIEGGLKYIVSEKLKKEMENAGCTGIEFQPIELSYNEWTSPGGEREKIYGKV